MNVCRQILGLPKILVLSGDISQETENKLKEDFPHLKMLPEEYAARYSHYIGVFALDAYNYRDKNFKKWMKRFGEIIRNREQIKTYRQQFLTKEEIEKIEREQEEMTF